MYTNTQRLEKLRTLPETIQDMYGAISTGQVLISIHQKYALADIGPFIDTVGDVMLGFYPKSLLPELLKKNLGVPELIANQIASDLRDLLKPVSDVPAAPIVPIAAVPAAVAVPTPKPAEVSRPAVPQNVQTVAAVIPRITTPSIPAATAQHPPVQQPPILVRKEPGMIGARTMNSDIATLKKNETAAPQVPQVAEPKTALPIAPRPQVAPAPQPSAAPIPKPPVTATPEPLPVPRYAKPLTDLPRYGGQQRPPV